MQKISLVAAMAKNRVIGKDNQMPWHLPADLAHFKRHTVNKPIIMGRKTYESIGRPLPKRRNIILSRQPGLEIDGCEVFDSLKAALESCDTNDVAIIGGGYVFKEALPLATHMLLTFIDLETEGDAFFPDWDANDWQITEKESHLPDEKNPYPYQFVTFERHVE